ncbi:ribonuclease HI [Enterococcus hulanensis]|uniref:ribonuclease H family protein n=1 Tax=Enterococcus hulanensis TaxID=2559929 RepID=UPI00289152A4|nr:ribonuclease H [Enterococcus hulanensis]MDT2659248.1 ribonuclease HI [Enterococcus hulanensis]
MDNQDREIGVYSDGGCRIHNNVKGNIVSSTDKCAYAYRIEIDNQVIHGGKAMYGKTNNQMELLGFIAALTRLVDEGLTDTEITAYLDSEYVLKGVQRMSNWKANGWRKANKKEIANKDEWILIDILLQKFSSIKYIWVKGHADSSGNNAVDELLNQMMDDLE